MTKIEQAVFGFVMGVIITGGVVAYNWSEQARLEGDMISFNTYSTVAIICAILSIGIAGYACIFRRKTGE